MKDKYVRFISYLTVVAIFTLFASSCLASAEARTIKTLPKRTVTIEHNFGYPYGITYVGPEPKILYSPSIRLKYNRQLPDYKNIYVPSLRGYESLLDFYRITPVPRYSR